MWFQSLLWSLSPKSSWHLCWSCCRGPVCAQKVGVALRIVIGRYGYKSSFGANKYVYHCTWKRDIWSSSKWSYSPSKDHYLEGDNGSHHRRGRRNPLKGCFFASSTSFLSHRGKNYLSTSWAQTNISNLFIFGRKITNFVKGTCIANIESAKFFFFLSVYLSIWTRTQLQFWWNLKNVLPAVAKSYSCHHTN